MSARCCAVALLLPLLLPLGAHADIVVPTDHSTIAAAVAAAASGDTIRILRGTYTEAISLATDVVLEGEEAAGTWLTGTIEVKAAVTLRRLTIKDNGVTVAAGGSGRIENSIFRNVSGAALTVNAPLAGTTSQALEVFRNTFYGNGVGIKIAEGREDVAIQWNIFGDNTTAIDLPDGASDAGITESCFALKGNDVAIGADATTEGLEFVDATLTDSNLHLTRTSACTDRGAYSGDDPDLTPAPVTNLKATQVSAGTVHLAWTAKPAFGIDVDKYLVRFKGTGEGAAYVDLTEVSPRDEEAAYEEDVSVKPDVPTGVTATPRSQGLHIAWTDAERATGHEVHLGTEPGAYADPEDAEDKGSLDLTGLENGVRYYVAVSAYVEGSRTFEVVARSAAKDNLKSRPAESSALTLTRADSALSEPVSGMPEDLQGYPALEDKGACFVRASAGQDRTGAIGAALALAVLALTAHRRRRPWLGALLAAAAWGAPSPAQAGWTLGASAGVFYPAEEDWADHYGKRYLPDGKVSLGYVPFSQLELGLDAGYRQDRGHVTESSTGEPLDAEVNQTLSVLPVQAYALLNLRFAEGQWVVPFVAGGYGRYWYRLKVDGADTVRGYQDGYHARAGLKLLLDPLDPRSAENAQYRYGVRGTYVVLEAQKAWVDDRGDAEADLGGITYSGGLTVEF